MKTAHYLSLRELLARFFHKKHKMQFDTQYQNQGRTFADWDELGGTDAKLKKMWQEGYLRDADDLIDYLDNSKMWTAPVIDSP